MIADVWNVNPRFTRGTKIAATAARSRGYRVSFVAATIDSPRGGHQLIG